MFTIIHQNYHTMSLLSWFILLSILIGLGIWAVVRLVYKGGKAGYKAGKTAIQKRKERKG
jgi:hypothetical protein